MKRTEMTDASASMDEMNETCVNSSTTPGANKCMRKRKLGFSPPEYNVTLDQDKWLKKDDSKNKSSITQSDTASKIENKISEEHAMEFDPLMKKLQAEIKESEEQLRKLKMTKMYREKNNLEELGELIEKWRDVSQQALGDLLQLHPSPQPSMSELITHLQIDYDLVHYDKEEEAFM